MREGTSGQGAAGQGAAGQGAAGQGAAGQGASGQRGAPPAAAVIIPHYNDVARLLRCLDALAPQCGPGAPAAGGGIELVVVDNGSTEPLDPVRARHPWARIVTEPRKGAANARNRGVAETTAPLLLFIDSDCLPAPDWVAVALTALDRAGADLVGGRVSVFDETPPPRTGAQAFETVFAFDFRTYIEKKGFSGSGNLVTRRDVFAATGPFVHGLSEDIDWCRRATARGFRLAYDDSLRVGHPSRNDWPALVRKWRRVTEESFGLNGRTLWRRAVWAARALAMPVSVLVHAPRVVTHPALHGPGERARALATLARIRLARAGWMLGQALRG
jgi:GT2 family glycosyltransferase